MRYALAHISIIDYNSFVLPFQEMACRTRPTQPGTAENKEDKFTRRTESCALVTLLSTEHCAVCRCSLPFPEPKEVQNDAFRF